MPLGDNTVLSLLILSIHMSPDCYHITINNAYQSLSFAIDLSKYYIGLVYSRVPKQCTCTEGNVCKNVFIAIFKGTSWSIKRCVVHQFLSTWSLFWWPNRWHERQLLHNRMWLKTTVRVNCNTASTKQLEKTDVFIMRTAIVDKRLV